MGGKALCFACAPRWVCVQSRANAVFSEMQAMHVVGVEHIFAMFNKGLLVIDSPTLRNMLMMLEATRQYDRMLRFLDTIVRDYAFSINQAVFEKIAKSLCQRSAVCVPLPPILKHAKVRVGQVRCNVAVG